MSNTKFEFEVEIDSPDKGIHRERIRITNCDSIEEAVRSMSKALIRRKAVVAEDAIAADLAQKVIDDEKIAEQATEDAKKANEEKEADEATAAAKEQEDSADDRDKAAADKAAEGQPEPTGGAPTEDGAGSTGDGDNKKEGE